MGQDATMVLFSDTRNQQPCNHYYLAVKFYCVALHRSLNFLGTSLSQLVAEENCLHLP